MLTFTSEDRDGTLILRAIDEEVDIEGKPYSDWTTVSSMSTTVAVMQTHLQLAAERLKRRYLGFLSAHSMPSPKKMGRVVVGHVIDIRDTMEAQKPTIDHAMRRQDLLSPGLSSVPRRS